jgi:hypothetical protein
MRSNSPRLDLTLTNASDGAANQLASGLPAGNRKQKENGDPPALTTMRCSQRRQRRQAATVVRGRLPSDGSPGKLLFDRYRGMHDLFAEFSRGLVLALANLAAVDDDICAYVTPPIAIEPTKPTKAHFRTPAFELHRHQSRTFCPDELVRRICHRQRSCSRPPRARLWHHPGPLAAGRSGCMRREELRRLSVRDLLDTESSRGNDVCRLRNRYVLL